MKMLICLALVTFCFAEDAPKKPNGSNGENQTQSSSVSPPPITVNCNQSTGAVADRNEQKTPERDTSIQWANWVLVLVASLTGLAIWQQTKETRRSVLISLRPKLRIRGIAVVDRGESGFWVDCRIANTGGSGAKIIASNLTMWQQEPGQINGPLPVFPPYDDSRNWIGKRKILPGQYEQIGLPLGISQSALAIAFMNAAKETGHNMISNLYCLGFIQYRDKLKVERRTAFCMRYVIDHARFERVKKEPNYDYAD